MHRRVQQLTRALRKAVLPAWGMAACLAIPSAGPAQSSTEDPLLTQARRLMKAKYYAGAMPLLLQSANHQHAEAMRELGLIYAQGLGRRTPDPKWGLQWLQQAAAGGDVASAYRIADLYASGSLGQADGTLARFWYTKSYAAHDAYGAMGLAELACSGLGEKQNLSRCDRLLAEANVLPASDGSTPAMRLGKDLHVLGDAYGTSGSAGRASAWAAYRRSAATGDATSAVAACNLLLGPRSSPGDLAKASAALDSYVMSYRRSHPRVYDLPEHDHISALYVAIGDAYQRLGVAQTAHAIPVYAAAAQLGDSQPAIRLAMRYAQGKSVPQSLSAAAKQLLALPDPFPRSAEAKEYVAALQFVTKALRRSGHATGVSATVAALSHREAELRYAPPLSPPPPPPEPLPDFVPPGPTTPAQRFPNLIAPPSVTPLQKFPVMVSLNSFPFDKSTAILSGGQADGEVQVPLPSGMAAVQIGVTLIAPAMRSVDGVFTQTIDLTANQDSTTAIFQLQAGATAGAAPILATLTYNGAFLAQIRRDVQVASDAPAPTPVPAAPNVSAPAPAPDHSSQANVLPVTHKVVLYPEKRAPDIMIQEVQTGDILSYTVYAPGFGFAGPTVVTGAMQRQAIVAKLYSDLEAQGNNLDQIGGPSASQQAKDFAEGKGNELYDNLVPDAFKMIYGKMKAAGSPPRTIQVLTSSPSLPWELVRPRLADGTREAFLGTTVALVTADAASVPRVPPPLDEALQTVKVVAPHYDGDLSLAGAQQEVIALKASFPALTPVDGTVDSVSTLGRTLPDGIIHFAGHGLRVTQDGLPPDVGLSLTDGSMVPSTWKNLTEQTPSAHPFYFFNACDLGRSDVTLDYISGWASTLMQSGASGYLGALWKVSDATASSFAKHFYADLKVRLAGEDPWSVAEVVTQARRETYLEAFDPTALAYLLYADPYQTFTDQE